MATNCGFSILPAHVILLANMKTKVTTPVLVLFFFALLQSACSSGPRPVGAATGREALIRSDYAPGELAASCASLIQQADEELKRIEAIPADQRNFDGIAIRMENALADFNDRVSPLTFMKYVSTNETVSKEGAECDEKTDAFWVTVATRKGLYDALRAVKPRTAEEKVLHKEILLEFERNGMKLPEKRREEVKKLKVELSQLESQFSTNLNQDQSTIEFTEDELKGLPEDFIKRLGRSKSGKLIVTAKPTDYGMVMENAVSGETRRRMALLYQRRAAEKNVPLLEKAIVLRQKIARLMGYKTWADYRTEDRMAKNSATVLKFLGNLRGKLAEANRSDLAKLGKFQLEIDPEAKKVNAWDTVYLSYQLKKRDFDLDNEKIREYFPVDTVLKGMFGIYSRLFGVELHEIKGARTWADGVKLYSIRDADTKELIAHFYADFFPRPMKYGHAAAFTLVAGRMKEGKYQAPVSAIVANFTPPANGKPSLLTHDEVETVFHEFGHIMHQTLTRAPYASLSGTRTSRDFVEAPSQMLEEWVWSPEMLQELSGHYKDSSKKLPKELLDRMIAARDFNLGLFYTRQLFLGLLDMTYHTSRGPVDTTQVHHRLYREINGMEPLVDGRFQAGFGHLMGGYDAGYYGYLWSAVYAADMFSRFESEGLLNADLGKRYRRTVLERGKMVEASQLLKDFLGREPNPKAFFKKLKIQM